MTEIALTYYVVCFWIKVVVTVIVAIFLTIFCLSRPPEDDDWPPEGKA